MTTSTANVFLDTNILVYAAMPRDGEAAKTKKARDLIAQAEFGTSSQVLGEFYTVVTRKGGRCLTARQAFSWIENFLAFPCLAIDAKLVMDAIVIAERYQIHYYDSVIIAAAGVLGAKTLYTEDLNHRQSYGGVEAVNPFL